MRCASSCSRCSPPSACAHVHDSCFSNLNDVILIVGGSTHTNPSELIRRRPTTPKGKLWRVLAHTDKQHITEETGPRAIPLPGFLAPTAGLCRRKSTSHFCVGFQRTDPSSTCVASFLLAVLRIVADTQWHASMAHCS